VRSSTPAVPTSRASSSTRAAAAVAAVPSRRAPVGEDWKVATRFSAGMICGGAAEAGGDAGQGGAWGGEGEVGWMQHGCHKPLETAAAPLASPGARAAGLPHPPASRWHP